MLHKSTFQQYFLFRKTRPVKTITYQSVYWILKKIHKNGKTNIDCSFHERQTHYNLYTHCIWYTQDALWKGTITISIIRLMEFAAQRAKQQLWRC